MKTVKLDKISAIRLEIERAIELLFRDQDHITVTLLTHSAWTIIRELNPDQNTSRDQLLLYLPNLKPKDVWDILNSDFNFLKHAKKDPDKLHSFDINHISTSLLLVSADYISIYGINEIMITYQLWYIASNEAAYNHLSTYDLYKKSQEKFPNLHKLPFQQRYKYGMQELLKLKRKNKGLPK